MRVVYHPFAEAELIEALHFYEQQRQGLGSRLLDAIDDAACEIGQNPLWCEVIGQDVRRASIRGFPYSLFFRIVATDEVRILAVKHHSRKSNYWKRRR